MQPLRVAEKMAMLDVLSNGRAILGMGRGLARREFDQFGVPMSESRERYDEAAPLVLEALETGWFPEHQGKFFQQPRAPLRPPLPAAVWHALKVSSSTGCSRVAVRPISRSRSSIPIRSAWVSRNVSWIFSANWPCDAMWTTE